MVMADGLLGVMGAILAGSLLALGIAVALSPLAPIGPVRPLYPEGGVSSDWTVLGFGFPLFLVPAFRGRGDSGLQGGAPSHDHLAGPSNGATSGTGLRTRWDCR